MAFSDRLYISGVQTRKPENEGEWARKLLDILLSDSENDEEVATNDYSVMKKGAMRK